MNYSKTLDYIDSFIDFEKLPRYAYASSFRLERMHEFLKGLGNPHLGLNTIHIAGSKGKGSTCAIIASILKEAGYSVGLYTSPHLLDVRERIKIAHKSAPRLRSGQASHKRTSDIEEKDFVELIERIRPVAERFRDHSKLGKLSFFEVLTACAFLYFKEKKVDFAVMETGLGGRLDATNVTEPLICGITNISLEHTDKLGSSLEEIAREKAGIIKPRGIVFSAPQDEKVIGVIKDVCREKNAKLYEAGREMDKDLEINLIGRHQIENASLAVSMLSHMNIKGKAVRKGLKKVLWPGRLQVVRKDPYVILDGAHNAASMKAILSSIKENFEYDRLIVIFGISGDKDIKGVSGELDRVSDLVILTRSTSNRAKEPFSLKENFSRTRTEIANDVEEALKLSFSAADKEDLILVTGSLYLVGDAMRFWPRRNLAEAKPRPAMHCRGFASAS